MAGAGLGSGLEVWPDALTLAKVRRRETTADAEMVRLDIGKVIATCGLLGWLRQV